ncbi:MAG: DUF4340 domain-containing protein, partial [Deltaproteobacteria bacterium]|nr:DUF4340 domain-containing protein [Deltaproteobacteria bacterium]
VGFGGAGEVEDYRVAIQKAQNLDFGDAPDSFSTLLASNGPRHSLGGPRLGALNDPEVDGAPSTAANGDNLAGANDEDGVSQSALIVGGTTTATVTLTGKNGTATVLIGDRTPTGSSVYVRKENSPQVVLLGASVGNYQELIFETAGIKKQ